MIVKYLSLIPDTGIGLVTLSTAGDDIWVVYNKKDKLLQIQAIVLRLSLLGVNYSYLTTYK